MKYTFDKFYNAASEEASIFINSLTPYQRHYLYEQYGKYWNDTRSIDSDMTNNPHLLICWLDCFGKFGFDFRMVIENTLAKFNQDHYEFESVYIEEISHLIISCGSIERFADSLDFIGNRQLCPLLFSNKYSIQRFYDCYFNDIEQYMNDIDPQEYASSFKVEDMPYSEYACWSTFECFTKRLFQSINN